MKFAIARDVLAQTVAWVARTAPTRPAAPILAGVRITVSDTSLELATFDYETSARAVIDADVETTGVIVVQAKLLSDIVNALPAGGTVTVEEDGGKVVVRSGKSRFTLAAMPASDYPTLPVVPSRGGLIDAETFAKLVNQVNVAASKDATVPLLTAVQLAVHGSDVTAIATDRYRLGKGITRWDPDLPDAQFSILVRSKVLHDAAKSVAGSGDVALTVSSDQGMVAFSAGGRQVTTLVIGGDYPAVERLFPDQTPIVATVNRTDLLAAVKRVSLVAERNAPIRLTFADENVTVSVVGGADEAQATEELPGATTGQDGSITIAFNPMFLQDGLSAIDTPNVQFGATTYNKPVLIWGANEDEEPVSGFKYLIVPIRTVG